MPCGRCSEALDKALAAGDWPSVAEISRRELEKSPHDAALWRERIAALIKIDAVERASREIAKWEMSSKPPASLVEELRGDIAAGGDHDDEALEHWRAATQADPRAVVPFDKIAALAQRIKIQPSPAACANRAVALLHLARYTGALAEIRRASALDATDEKVKDLLPRFESLEKKLPLIRALDAKIAANPADPTPLLDRAQIFHDGKWDMIAVGDAAKALQLAPGSRRAALQAALRVRQDDGNSYSSAIPGVLTKALPVAAVLLVKIGGFDAQLLAQPGDTAALTARAALLNDAAQFALASEDAEAALKARPDDPAALVESGRALAGTRNNIEAAARFERACELDPQNAGAWFCRAELSGSLAKHGEAVEFATRSIAIRETAVALRVRERSLRALGRKAEADRDALKLTGTKK
jgi:tetratricopeptide (TPR) repeat protein